MQDSKLSIERSVFLNCRSKADGTFAAAQLRRGGAALHQLSGRLDVRDTVFENCTAASDGEKALVCC